MPDNNKPLFWYPGLNHKFDFDKPIDQGAYFNSYVLYFLNRLQSMFKYDGLPETIPAKYLENYLLVNGHCAFFMNGDKGLVVSSGSWSGIPDLYYTPKEYIIANPYVEDSARKTYTIGEDCIVMRNDTYCMGVMPLLHRYCRALTTNDVTMDIADVLARATLTITALTAKDKESVELWLKRLKEGHLSAIGELPAMTGNQDRSVNIQPFQSTAATLTDLIEYHQYLKAGLFNELGLNSNYNMKRESINSNESQLNDDMLHPLIDDMLKMRREALEQVNEMFGTNITVDFDSAWKDNEIENEVAIEAMETMNEDNNIDESSGDVSGDAVNDDADLGTPDTEMGEETPEEVTEEVPEETTIEESINELTDAVEALADSITEDAPEEEKKEDNE